MTAPTTKQDVPAMASLGDLLAPVDAGGFMATIFGKKVLHIDGPAEKFEHVMSWSILNRLLNMAVWTDKSLQLILDTQRVPAAAFCTETVNRNGQTCLQPDAGAVMGLIDRGAAMVLNDIETLDPGMLSVVGILERTFGAKCAANLYCSWRGHQGFGSHFDRHEVFSLHVIGEKRWHIYQGRADHPVEHEMFHNVPQEQYDQLKGPIDREVVMRPGDLLYLPRGQFHDAMASSQAAVHVTFSMALPTGLDWLTAIWNDAVRDTLFRADFPLPGDDAAIAEHIRHLHQRFTELATNPQAITGAQRLRRQFGMPRSDFTLPPVKRRR